MTISTIREILGERPLHSVAPGDLLADAARLMAEHEVGAVVVIEGEKLVGILSERDIVFRGVARDLPVASTTAADIMSRDLTTVAIDDAISDTLAAKLGDAFRHLPVMDGGRVAGLLSFRDIPAEYQMMFERFREMSSAKADGGA